MVSFDGDVAEISDHEGHHVCVKREELDGLWIGCGWSKNNVAINARINHIQIDNQLQYTMFPTLLYPIVSKSVGNYIRMLYTIRISNKFTLFIYLAGKPFIELSVFKSNSLRPNTI